MQEVVVIDAARTPIGKYGGVLKSMTATDLAAVVIKALVERNSLDLQAIDQVIMGCTLQNGENAYASRVAMLKAGLANKTTALTVNRLCGSGLEAVNQAAQQILLGMADVCIAGGMESMSNAPYLSYGMRWGARINDTAMIDGMVAVLTDPRFHYHMGVTAENLAESHGISRREQDEFAAWSHQKAIQAQFNRVFEREIVPVEIVERKKTVFLSQDESSRTDTTIEALAMLPPVFKKDGTVTAGNSSSLNDAAAALVVMSAKKATELGYKARARLLSQAVVGVAPEIMGLGPVAAVPKALRMANLQLQDIDLIELNEAFAAQVLAVNRELLLDQTKLNTNGGAIALGHPLGASGAILLVKALYELERINKRFGLVALCVGGGQGMATVLERIV
jgi:acetyl-CoA C-acetyltransferase